MALCCFFGYMEVKRQIKSEMLETAREVSAYGDLADRLKKMEKQELEDEEIGLDEIPFADELTLGISLKSRLRGDYRIDRYVKGGIDAISLIGSELYTRDECIRIVCSYELKPPVSLFNLGTIPVTQQIEYRYFTGYKVKSLLARDEEESAEGNGKVYVTENGRVYHSSMSCPNLKLTIRDVPLSEVSKQRNKSGGKYYPCEKCAKGTAPSILYITSDGDSYHYSLECSGLKRTVKEVDKADLPEGFEACKRCRKKED